MTVSNAFDMVLTVLCCQNLVRTCISLLVMQVGSEKKPFVQIRSSVHVLERIACSVKLNEPVLLVGETGTGKTTLVQSLAARLAQKLVVLVC